MSDKKKDTKKDFKKNKTMLAYGVIQLGSAVVSAVALVAIALSFCSCLLYTSDAADDA